MVQTHQQVGDCAFAGSAGAHEGDGLAALNHQVDAAHRRGELGAVAEADMVEANLPLQLVEGLAAKAYKLLIGIVEDRI